MAKSVNNKTYQNFKDSFSQEYQIQNELATTTRKDGYANIRETRDNTEEISKIHEAVISFANARAEDRKVFNTLIKTNAHLQQQLLVLQEQNLMMQEMMCNMTYQLPNVHYSPETGLPSTQRLCFWEYPELSPLFSGKQQQQQLCPPPGFKWGRDCGRKQYNQVGRECGRAGVRDREKVRGQRNNNNNREWQVTFAPNVNRVH